MGNTALEQPMRLEALKDDETDYQAYWGTKIQCITRGEHGYYYLTPEEPLYLMYWDDDTQESIKLCAKADCNHDNAACNAYFGDVRYYDRTAQAAEYASGFQIYYYNGFLYLLGTEGNLIQVSPDGSERKELPRYMTMTEPPIPSWYFMKMPFMCITVREIRGAVKNIPKQLQDTH